MIRDSTKVTCKAPLIMSHAKIDCGWLSYSSVNSILITLVMTNELRNRSAGHGIQSRTRNGNYADTARQATGLSLGRPCRQSLFLPYQLFREIFVFRPMISIMLSGNLTSGKHRCKLQACSRHAILHVCIIFVNIKDNFDLLICKCMQIFPSQHYFRPMPWYPLTPGPHTLPLGASSVCTTRPCL